MKTIKETIKDYIETLEAGEKRYAKEKLKDLQRIERYRLPEDGDLLYETITDILKSSSNKSGKQYDVFRDYIDYLNSKGYEVQKLPEFRTKFERQILILKDLHDPNQTESLDNFAVRCSEKYLVSDRTVEHDFKEIREGIKLFGRDLKVDFARENGIISQHTTAHPLFLFPSLAQIVCMIEGLKELAGKHPLYKVYAEETAADIWAQLSDYAKDRITNVLPERLSITDTDFYRKLEEMASENRKHFREERSEEYRGMPEIEIIKAMKSETPAYRIVYPDGDGILKESPVIREEPRYAGDGYFEYTCEDGSLIKITNSELKGVKTVAAQDI